MNKKLYVGGLSYSVTDDQLQQLFAQHGTVESAKVITDKYTDRSRGFGFVEMGTVEEAEKAIQALNGSQHEGRKLTVNISKPREERSGGGGGYRDRYLDQKAGFEITRGQVGPLFIARHHRP